MSKRIVALLAATVAVGAGLAVAPAALAASPHDTSPVATSVALQSSQTPVTSSTKHKLRVELGASQSVATSSDDNVTISLANGVVGSSETHEWTFPVPSTALTIDATGKGTLAVPTANISPYGQVSLTITPVGSPTTQTCNGSPVSQTQNVSLAGTFVFITKSTGSHAWGRVSSATKTFTFAATNQITWTYDPSASFGCINLHLPCASGLFFDTSKGAASLEGLKSGSSGKLIASRQTKLSKPAGATRGDTAPGSAKPLAITSNGAAISLPVVGSGHAAGTATLTSKAKPSSYSIPCGKSQTETSTSWGGATYKNGKSPLRVAEQIFGVIKVANNSQAEVVRESVS